MPIENDIEPTALAIKTAKTKEDFALCLKHLVCPKCAEVLVMDRMTKPIQRYGFIQDVDMATSIYRCKCGFIFEQRDK